jgi:hypothetical protein
MGGGIRGWLLLANSRGECGVAADGVLQRGLMKH